jgi:hypothetical protein
MSSQARFDAAEVRKAVELLIEPGAVFEIRALAAKLSGNHRRGTLSGYFNNADACVSALAKITDAEGVYVMLNPVDPALFARCANRLDYPDKNATTGDQHIVKRHWLLLDADAERPSGISATDGEKEAARNKARRIYSYLKDRRWPGPVAADSGNGFHLLYRVDLPAADEGLVENVLAALADHFNGDGVKIDASVHNPARIVKLYGTLAAKGDHTPERPHRLSSIVKAPAALGVVTAEQLRALLSELAPVKPEPVSQPAVLKSARASQFDVEDFLSRYGIAVKEKIVEADGTIKWLLKECPFNPDHGSPDAAVFQRPDGSLGFKCFHNSCADKHWKDFRKYFEPERKAPRVEAPLLSNANDESSDLTSLTSPAAAEYPAQLEEAAFYGLAGDFVRRILPHTEADPVALLVHYLGAFGNAVGRNPHALADGSRHGTNIFFVCVGESSKSRKGTSSAHIKRIIKRADEVWGKECVTSGLSSGEGLIYAVRDPVTKRVKQKGGSYATEIVDDGVSDKRRLFIESEFASTLRVMSREGNTLSAVIRQAWDDGDLRTAVKNSPNSATGAHISIAAHVTQPEVRHELCAIDQANGFANRFLWFAVRRSKCLPEGGNLTDGELNDLVMRTHAAIEFAGTAGLVTRDDNARKLWCDVYPDLSEGKPGLLGAVTARAEAQVLRLSVIYALLDCSKVVKVEHLKAALALWRYCEDSARWIFETGTGNKHADRILAALKAAGEKGMTRLQINDDVFNRHASKFEIDEGLRTLYAQGLARRTEEETATRPAERWFYMPQPCEVCEESSNSGDTSHYSHPQTFKNADSGVSGVEAVCTAFGEDKEGEL